jgi:hypothetical protein
MARKWVCPSSSASEQFLLCCDCCHCWTCCCCFFCSTPQHTTPTPITLVPAQKCPTCTSRERERTRGSDCQGRRGEAISATRYFFLTFFSPTSYFGQGYGQKKEVLFCHLVFVNPFFVFYSTRTRSAFFLFECHSTEIKWPRIGLSPLF